MMLGVAPPRTERIAMVQALNHAKPLLAVTPQRKAGKAYMVVG